jgi:hypothetical protein
MLMKVAKDGKLDPQSLTPDDDHLAFIDGDYI